MSKRSAKESEKQVPDKKKLKTSSVTSKDAVSTTLARYFVRGERKFSGSQKLKYCPSEAAPTGQDDIKIFVEENGLAEGDVVNFSDDRDVETYIVIKNTESGSLGLVKNLNKSGSGYLTIPQEALRDVPNFFDKYKGVIESLPAVNFRLVVADDYLRGFLGSVPADGWEFDLAYTSGKLENFSARPTGNGNEFHQFNLEDTTWNDIRDFFAARSGGTKKVKVLVTLEGEKFETYKSRFSPEKKTKEWMLAKPDLPNGWSCERGKSSGSSSSISWEWEFSGPAETLKDMSKNIDTFLADFDHQYV